MVRIFYPVVDANGDAQTGKTVELFNATGTGPSWGWGTKYGDFSESGTSGVYYIEVSVSGRYGIKVDSVAKAYTLGMFINGDADGYYIIAPSSTTDEGIVIFDGTSGQVKDSAIKFRKWSAYQVFADSESWVVTDKFLKQLLASVANGKGASLLGIEDSAGNITATTVEGALAEIAALLANWTMSLAAETCSLDLIYYAFTNQVFIVTPPIVDGSGMSAQGRYVLDYVFKNDVVADPPNDISWGVETTQLSTSDSQMALNAPDNGDALYSGGTAGYCYMYARIRFENLSSIDNETPWSYDNLTIAEPDAGLTDAGVVDLLAAGGSNAAKVIKAIAGLISDDATIGRIIANYTRDYVTGAGTPAGTTTVPDFIGQLYFDSTNENWYKAVDTAAASDFKLLT